MRSFIQLYIANIREFVRDTSALFWMIAFPVMFILIFGVIFSSEDDVSFSIGLVNEDGEASARLVEGFEAIEAFDLHTGEREKELAELEDGDRSAVIVIPEGTGRAIGEYFDQLSSTSQQAALTQAPLEVYYDPSNQTRSQIVLNIIDQIIAEMNEGMTGIRPALAIEPRTVTADNLRSIDYLLPGILGMSLMQLGLFGTAGPLVSLREKGVLRRMGATPLSRVALLSSQVAFRLTTAVIQTGLIIVVGMIAFDVQIKIENLPVILGIVLLGASMFITLGYFLSGMAKTQEAVEGLVSLPNFVFMFLSGIFFPVEFMPDWIRPLVNAIPLTYLGDALRETMIEAGSYFSMTRNIGIMVAWLVVCAVLALRFFRWESQS
jgi:ABC-2 type transport system permease protein